jgi:uncharacterized protein YcfJ
MGSVPACCNCGTTKTFQFVVFTQSQEMLMKSIHLVLPLALAMGTAVLGAEAQPYPYAYPPPPPAYSQRAPTSYGYANVLRVTPAYSGYHTMEQQCDGPPQPKDTTGGTVLGAIVGGLIGNTVGRGNGRVAATAVGAVAGGAIGNNIAKNGDPGPPGCRMVDVVHNDNGQPNGFDVEYDYKGDVYVARMAYDPGNRIRVRVSVVPADEGPGQAGR